MADSSGASAVGLATNPWGTIAGAGISWLLGQTSGNNGNQNAKDAAAAADPFASQRGQYQGQLAALMSGTESMSQIDPNFNNTLAMGTSNLQRTMAASGQSGSGTEMAAIQGYGENLAMTDYNNQFNRLATLSGANSGSPSTAGQILQGQNQTNQQGLGVLGNALGQIAVDPKTWSWMGSSTPSQTGGWTGTA